MSEIEEKLREKAKDEADDIVREVKEYPDYFVNHGGADGTFSNACFWDDFGHLMPEIVNFAEECGGQV